MKLSEIAFELANYKTIYREAWLPGKTIRLDMRTHDAIEIIYQNIARSKPFIATLKDLLADDWKIYEI